MDFQKTIIRLLTEENNSLENLAKVAGVDARRFYKTANFRGADLSNEDLSKFDLSHSSVSGDLLVSIDDQSNLVRERHDVQADRVRMSATVSTYVHEFYSFHFFRRQSRELEKCLWQELDQHYSWFVEELREGNLEQQVGHTLAAMNSIQPDVAHRFAYTFSKRLRDEIYAIAKQEKCGSGYVLSSLIHFVFLNNERNSWQKMKPMNIERAIKYVPVHYGLQEELDFG